MFELPRWIKSWLSQFATMRPVLWCAGWGVFGWAVIRINHVSSQVEKALCEVSCGHFLCMHSGLCMCLSSAGVAASQVSFTCTFMLRSTLVYRPLSCGSPSIEAAFSAFTCAKVFHSA